MEIPGTPGFASTSTWSSTTRRSFPHGLASLFPLVSEAIGRGHAARPAEYVGLSHFEADECGSINEFLAVAPDAAGLQSSAAMTSVDDFADRQPRVLADKEELISGTIAPLVRHPARAARVGVRPR